MMRIGFGMDVHQLVEDRVFKLGGIKIPHHKGALGHSDADVLIHAICDALLGATALGDIGQHFPDTAEKYKNIDSTLLLQNVAQLIFQNGYIINNIDATIALQKPKIAPYIDLMREKLATVLNISISQISIKATTTEKMGYEGREEGITAYAVVLINSK